MTQDGDRYQEHEYRGHCMRFGAETNTRWLWFITYILLPLNVIGQTFLLFWLLDKNQGGFSLVLILAELGLAIATILGLHQQRSWGWYCIMVMFGIQLIGAPLKVHAKASMRYEVTQAVNGYLRSQGRSPIRMSEPSIFDLEPMLTFFMLMVIWTAPNMIYMYRRKQLFGIEQDVGNDRICTSTSKNRSVRLASTHEPIVTEEEETLYIQAASEFESGDIRQGLWTKITLDEAGPECQRAAYIRGRVAQLMHESAVLRPQRIRNARKRALKSWWQGKRNRYLIVDILCVIFLLLAWPLGIIVALIYTIQAIRVYCRPVQDETPNKCVDHYGSPGADAV